MKSRFQLYARRSLYLLSACSVICYGSVLIPPDFFWPAIYLAFAIPVVIAINICVLITLMIVRSKLLLFPLITLVLATPFILSTISIHKKEVPANSLSILSFNAHLFREHHNYSKFTLESINWVVDDESDIKCIQEYSTNSQWRNLDVNGQLKDKGYERFTFKATLPDTQHDLGMGIFSRYPMIDSGIVWEDKGSLNAGLFADIRIGTDTIRIYNVHLASMNLELAQYKNTDNYLAKMRLLLEKLKYGSIQRSEEIRTLLEHAASSPYRVIVCGDFNETPYGYNYRLINSRLSNVFEKAGNGFGFTYNSKMFFLRIDHQFAGDNIEPVSYSVDRSLKQSDHFPTKAVYRLN
ncbi:MAG TPA: endonuclease/exonuclease/phosphatase family protein [Cyclobacteriaceae bacterium]|nr:endonuclease/exonuclease/phosphatase family protein [Cyclobacteriaceae bacterium]